MAPKCRNELVPNSSELAFRRLGGKLTPSGRTRVWASNCTIRRVADGMVAESRSFLCLVLWSSSSEGEGQNTGLTYHAAYTLALLGQSLQRWLTNVILGVNAYSLRQGTRS